MTENIAELLTEVDELVFHVPPACQGQIVERAYACDPSGLFLRVTDRSDRSVEFYRASWDDVAGDVAAPCEPWNGEPSLIEGAEWARVRFAE